MGHKQTLYIVDIRDAVEKYQSLPAEVRRPASVVDKSFTDKEVLEMELEDIMHTVESRDRAPDTIRRFVSGFGDCAIELVESSKPMTNVGKREIERYSEVIRELATDVFQQLKDNGIYNKEGHIQGDFHSTLNEKTLVLAKYE
jgi:hypothetical protein